MSDDPDRRQLLQLCGLAVAGSGHLLQRGRAATGRHPTRSADGSTATPRDRRMYGIDPRHTCRISESLLPRTGDSVTRAWAFSVPGGVSSLVESSPALVGDTLYLGSHNEHAYALDANDGSKRWETHLGTDVRTSPAVVDGTVYIGAGPSTESPDGHLYALDAATGAIQWEFEPRHTGAGKPEAVWSSPVVDDGTVFVGPKTGYITSLDADDGSLNWETYVSGWIEGALAVTDDTVYAPAGSGEGGVYAVNRADGSQRWSYSPDVDISQTDSVPTVHDGRVIVCTRKYGADDHPYLQSLDAETGELQWERQFERGMEDVAVEGDRIYAHNGQLRALSLRDGSTQWTVDTGGGATPLVVGDLVVASGTRTYAVDKQTGERRWSVEYGGGGMPAVRRNRLFVVDFEGTVAAYDFGGGESGPPPVVDDRAPTDPDGDGRYEDVNGDGEATPGDATVLFEGVFERDTTLTEHTASFDFNGDGTLTPGDATVLFDELF